MGWSVTLEWAYGNMHSAEEELPGKRKEAKERDQCMILNGERKDRLMKRRKKPDRWKMEKGNGEEEEEAGLLGKRKQN